MAGTASSGIQSEYAPFTLPKMGVQSLACLRRINHRRSASNRLPFGLGTLTERKAIALLCREGAAKRGTGQVSGESVFGAAGGMAGAAPGIGQLAGWKPTPQFAAAVAEQLEHRLARLKNDQLRQVVLAKLESHTNQKAAEKLGINLRAVEREVRLIREARQQEFDT